MKKLTLLLFSFFSLAFAQNVVISPQSIVVNPRPSFEVDVFLDRGDAAGIPSYEVGSDIRIGVRVSETSYVYLFNVRSNGEVVQILPNRFDQAGQNNFLQAGETKYFPPQGARYSFEVQGPTGLDKVIAVASRNRLDVSTLAQFTGESDFATSNQGERSFAETLSIIVRPLPQETWVTDTALFYVGAQVPPQPRFGTLNVTSNPSGATVFVDGQFVGYTPVRYGTETGSHTVRVELSGYSTFQTQVNVSGGRTQPVHASLNPIARNGTVNFRSQPSGAEVYVNGNFVGTTPTGSITFTEGGYEARFSLPGYSDALVSFSVGANSNQVVSANLVPQTGSLIVQGNVGGAQVYIDGQAYGVIPSGSGRLNIGELSPGSYELTVVAPGYGSAVQNFEIRGGRTTELRVSQARLR